MDAPAVDFLGRVETFERDFDGLCLTFGLTVSERVDVNRRDTTPTPGPDAETKYAQRMTRRTLDKLNRLFEKDFDLFGYIRL